MRHAPLTRERILAELDQGSSTGRFPILDNGYVYLADAQLSAYGDTVRWALLIEVLGTDVRFGGHDSLTNHVYCFGNCLRVPPGETSGISLTPTADGPEGPTFADDDVTKIQATAQTIRIRDTMVPLPKDQRSLEQHGIRRIDPPDLLRSLARDYRHLLFATEAELQQRIPPALPLLLRLDAWYHPDIMADELPSTTETFQMIADIFITGSAFHYQARRAPNTHWIDWPDGGIL